MPTFLQEIERMSPQYQGAYAEGYEAAKKSVLRKLKKLLADVGDSEPFPTATSTISFDV